MNNPRLKKIADTRKAVKAAKTLAEKREIFLNFVSTFFTLNNRSTYEPDPTASCAYYNKKNYGCAIGMFLTPKTAKFLDKPFCCEETGVFINSSIGSVLQSSRKNKIPKWMRDLGLHFLSRIQTLHDTIRNWDENGLTGHGRYAVASIRKKFNLT